MYVFDTSPLSTLFKNYYPKRFPTLWKNFDGLVAAGGLVSTREAYREILDGPSPECRAWAESNQPLFSTPTAAEGAFVGKIYGVQHFHQNLEQQKLLKGGRNADPFIIARAVVEERTVVTMERFKANAAKIPNICQHFNVRCMTLEEFMEAERWVFLISVLWLTRRTCTAVVVLPPPAAPRRRGGRGATGRRCDPMPPAPSSLRSAARIRHTRPLTGRASAAHKPSDRRRTRRSRIPEASRLH